MDLGDTRNLLRGARQGQTGARDALLQRLRPRLVLWVATRLSPALRAKIDPEDVVQDVLVAAHKSLDEFQGDDQRAFLAWLFRIAENRIRDYADHFGAQKRHTIAGPPAGGERAAPADSPSGVLQRREMCARVHAALGGLSDDHRQVIQLLRIEEQPVPRVAEIMDRSENAVRVLYCRAMRALRGALATDATA